MGFDVSVIESATKQLSNAEDVANNFTVTFVNKPVLLLWWNHIYSGIFFGSGGDV